MFEKDLFWHLLVFDRQFEVASKSHSVNSYTRIVLCRFVTLPSGSMGVYDPTEIRNRGLLLCFQKEAFIKTGYHLVTFFVSLYG